MILRYGDPVIFWVFCVRPIAGKKSPGFFIDIDPVPAVTFVSAPRLANALQYSSLKTLLKFRKALWAVLQSFGPWGVFIMAALDGAGLPLPGAVDAVLISYAYVHPGAVWLFVVLAACGSALGSLVLYMIGYWGGEVLIERRMSPEKFQKIRNDFDRHPFIAIAIPALMPPPFPLKVLVLAAGAFEMKWTEFLAAIAAARLVRFSALALFTIKFGPTAVKAFQRSIRSHPFALLAGIAVVVIIILLILGWRRRRKPESA